MTLQHRSAWLFASAWILLIFAGVPFVRRIQEWIESIAGAQVLMITTVTLLAIGGICAVVAGIRLRGRFTAQSLVWLAVIVGIAIWWAGRLSTAAEAVHLVEYGTLGVLLYRALRFHIPDAAVFIVAALAGTIVGTVDELIQWLTPLRYFDYPDVWLNCGTSLLTQAALFKGVGVAEGRRRPTVASLRRVVALAVVLVALIGLCLVATPMRAERWAGMIPALRHITDHDDVITEYGYQHSAPDIGVFYSRFTIAELQEEDRRNSIENAALLDVYRRHARYREFLDTYTSGRAPFLHEARVHIFSRNENRALARKAKSDPDLYAHHMTRAWREQLILERFFGTTFGLTKTRLGKKRRLELEIENQPERHFESKVSAHLITRVSESEAVFIAIGLFVILVGAYWRLGIVVKALKP